MKATRALNALALLLVALAAGAIVARNLHADAPVSLLNVSYDPTRELYAHLNPEFSAAYARSAHTAVQVQQAHGGSSRQARSVISGELEADVVTLGLPSDVAALEKRGLIAPGWASRLPNDSHPYYSTVVFVVRAGNPRNIRDWPDLLQPGVEIITPDPRTSGQALSSVACPVRARCRVRRSIIRRTQRRRCPACSRRPSWRCWCSCLPRSRAIFPRPLWPAF